MEDKTFEQYLDEAFDELEEAERELDLQLLDEDISEEFCFEPTSRDTAILSLYEGDEETVVVPGQIGGFRVTAIADGAFFMRDKLQTLILPDSVETIRDFALQECRALRRLVLPRNLRSLGKMAISGSPLLEKVELPAECEKYVLREGILFSADGTSLLLCPPAGGLCEYAVPEGVRRIEKQAFNDCTTLQKVTLPEGLQSIDELAFSNTGLREVDLPDSLTELGNYAFSSCRHLRRISLGESLWRINGGCLAGCCALKEIGLHPLNPALQLEDGFLLDDTGRVLICAVPGRMRGKVILPHRIRELEDYAFASCDRMTHLRLHEDVERIGSCAFGECSALQKIRIPDKVREIGFFTFVDCRALEEVILNEGLRAISGFAFVGCNALRQVQIHRHTIIECAEEEATFYDCPAKIELLP